MIRFSRPAILLVLTLACVAPGDRQPFPVPGIEWDPRRYVCYRTEAPPLIDGRLDEDGWEAAPWTAEFVDIRGPAWPTPRQRTRAKLLWDAEHLYIGARLEETDVWGTLTERDSVIYHDPDFEVFLDPDGDTHGYYELEINPLGTEWDLLLEKPYRDAESPAIDAWDIEGLRTAIFVDGTLNRPGDVDRFWSVEIAIPWSTIDGPPADGDRWRVNFSRVQWQTEVVDGQYVKLEAPEDNWVWSPQGLIAMHYPEMWGFVQFSGRTVGNGEEAFVRGADEEARWALRRFYYARRPDAVDPDLTVPAPAGYSWPPVVEMTADGYVATTTGPDGTQIRIRQDGRIW